MRHLILTIDDDIQCFKEMEYPPPIFENQPIKVGLNYTPICPALNQRNQCLAI